MWFSVEDLIAGYGRITVLHGVNLTVAQGEIICVIGPNGAGKSTVLRAISGQIQPRKGRVTFLGMDISHWGPKEKGQQGIVFIPQGDNVFPRLTIMENLEIAGFLLKDREQRRKRMRDVFETFPWMSERGGRPARELSGGQRQMLALGRILLLRPRLVLLDEPSLGLAPMVVEEVFQQIKDLNRGGVSFLLVEQNARKGLSVSHRGYVLELGRNRLAGPGRELLEDPQVRRLYLGG